MFVGEQVMEQLCPGLVLVQYPGFVFLDDEIGPCHSLGDFRRLPRCPRSYRPTRIFRCHRPAPGIPLYQVPRHGRTCTFETPSCIPFSPCCSPQIVVRISSVLSRIPMKLYSRASVRPRNLLFPLLLTFFVFCRRCAPWLGVSPVRLVGGCRIIRWLPPVIPAVGSPAIP